jgi:flagellar motor switch protein FliM
VNAGLITHFAEILRKSLAKFTDTWPAVIKLENNPGYLGGYSDGEAFCIMRYIVKIGAVDGPVEIALPFAAFGPVRDVFDPQGVRDTRSESELREDRRRILGMIQGTASEIVVELGATATSLEAVLALREGDLLHLSQDVEAPLRVVVEGQDTWLGEPGRVGNRRAVRLVRKLTKE